MCTLLLLGSLFHDVLAVCEVSCGSCNEDGRQCTEDDTQYHSEGERADAGAAEAEDDCQNDERRDRGVDGTVQGAVQRLVEKLLLVALRVQAEELADAVEDYHLIVDGVTDSGQHGTDERLVDLEREGHPAPADAVHSQDEDDIDKQRCDGTEGERQVAEADEDIDKDGDEGEDDAC